MASRPAQPVIIEVKFEGRDDGGLRAYCDNVPGFVLSHADPEAVLADVEPALETILSAMYGMDVCVRKAETVGAEGNIRRYYTSHTQHRGFPVIGADSTAVATALLAALKAVGGEDVLIMGSVQDSPVLIDGNFDLIEVAEVLLASLRDGKY